MAVTVIDKLSNLDQADVLTDWSASGGASGLGINTELNRTGSGCVGVKVSNEEGGVTLTFPGGSRNMTGEHIYVWANFQLALDPVGTGMRIILDDGTNANEYEMLNSTNYSGGYVRLCLQCDATPTVDNSADITAITDITIEVDTTVASGGNNDTFVVDRIDVQPSSVPYAIEINGGTTGDRGTWAEIIADSVNDALGIVERRAGVVALNGPVSFGITTATDSFFEDSNEVVMFQNQFVEDDFFGIQFVGNSGQTNQFVLGEEVGSGDDSRGVGGGVIKSAGATFHIKATDANIVVDFWGVSIDTAGRTEWEQTNAQAVSCSWTNSKQITHDNNAEMREGTISASSLILATHTGASDLDFNDNGGSEDTIVRPSGSWIDDGFKVGDEIVITSTSSNNISMTILALTATNINVVTATIVDEQNTSGRVEAKGSGAIQFIQNPSGADFRDMSIINCVHAIEWDLDGTQTLDLRHITYAGNTFDIRFNHESGLLTVNISELGDTPTTSDGGAGGTITVANTVSVTITVIDAETEVVIANARVGVEESISKIEIINVLTNGSGVAENTSYNLPGDPTSVDIRVFDIDDAGQNKNVKRVEDVTANGLSITIRLPNNPQYTPT